MDSMMAEALTALAADTCSREAFISAVASLTAALAWSMPSFKASAWALMRTSIWESSAIGQFPVIAVPSIRLPLPLPLPLLATGHWALGTIFFTLPPTLPKAAISSSAEP